MRGRRQRPTYTPMPLTLRNRLSTHVRLLVTLTQATEVATLLTRALTLGLRVTNRRALYLDLFTALPANAL